MKRHFVSVCLICVWAILTGRSIAAGRRRVIIDTDAGADDGVAILLALISESSSDVEDRFEIVAVTCTYGNTNLTNVEQNVLKTLTMANRTDIPVYGGAQKPLLNDFHQSSYFGKDGFGDFQFDRDISAKVDRSRHGAVALIELARRYSEVTLVCIGPLTNVATAIALDPSFYKRVKEIFIMGSSVAGVGNVRPNVEFNFNTDPESNAIVLNSLKEPKAILLPWETVLQSNISKDWRINVLGRRNNTLINFLNKAERISLERATLWFASDAMLMACMIWPKLVSTSLVTNVSPVTDGMARGSVLVDYGDLTTTARNAEIVQGFDAERFKSILLQYLG